jgi:hypothetical protein
VFPLLFAANSARNPDGQIGPEMNYFHGLKKAGLWMAGQASGAHAGGFWATSLTINASTTLVSGARA